MKTLFLFTLTVILALNLNARENPFEPTDSFEDEVGKIVQMDENSVRKSMEETPYIKEMQEKMSNVTGQNKNKVEENINKTMPVIEQKAYSKKEVDSLIQKTQKQTEQKAKEIAKKEVQKTTEPTQVVYVKPRSDVADDEALLTKTILPYLKVEFNDNKFIIHSEHKVSKKFSVDNENKIIIDYKGLVEFNTKKDSLESQSFKKIAVGNHKKEGYYRIAIELIDKPSKFEVDYKDDIITITKKN
ncbi:MAG: AMIN domain-containing protein [Campylobacterales bacterium]|nr:AMIN domain-containing protein [Campylobacterales bacterium]